MNALKASERLHPALWWLGAVEFDNFFPAVIASSRGLLARRACIRSSPQLVSDYAVIWAKATRQNRNSLIKTQCRGPANGRILRKALKLSVLTPIKG